MWIEEPNEEGFVVPDRVVDLSFAIACRTLPVDHAWELSNELNSRLPWLQSEPQCGFHLIYGADSGNGWERPAGKAEPIYLSRRTRLELRLPQQWLEAAQALTGQTLQLYGETMRIGEAKIRKLSDSTALYSRYILCEEEDESLFLRHNMAQLQQLGLTLKKVMAGKLVRHHWPDGDKLTRSLFVADLSRTDSVKLQESGLGDNQHLGFGLFIPHKTLS